MKFEFETNKWTFRLHLQTSNDSALDVLQSRQSAIIEQLKDLKEKLALMHKQLGVNATNANVPAAPAQNVSSSKKSSAGNGGELKPINAKYLQDVIVNVHPKNIPFSLLALQKIWQNRLNLIVKCYTHSSVTALPDQNQYFAKQLTKLTPNCDLPALNVSLIWKEIANTELICVPSSFIPILGEVNAVRYFSRVGPKEFGYVDADLIQSLEIDSVLDLCHQLFAAGNNAKERLTVLRLLGSKLGNRRFFGGDAFAVSDIAISSAFKQMTVSSKDIAPNLNTWVKQASTLFGY